jgi:hypothetical protein
MDFIIEAFVEKVEVVIHVTKQLRMNELGTIALGSNINELGIAIPPGEDSYTITSYCSNSCLRSVTLNLK